MSKSSSTGQTNKALRGWTCAHTCTRISLVQTPLDQHTVEGPLGNDRGAVVSPPQLLGSMGRVAGTAGELKSYGRNFNGFKFEQPHMAGGSTMDSAVGVHGPEPVNVR